MSRYRRKRVLFICIGNACRSPMAEAIARVDASDTIDAFSAGLAPIGFVTEMTKQTLRRNGYWVEGLESKRISPKVWEQVDIVINMSGRPRALAFDEYSKVEDCDIEDPYGQDPDTYQRVFEEIRLRVAKLAQECKQEDAAGSTQASPSNFQRQIEGICEQQNARLKTTNAPRPGGIIPGVSTSGEVTDQHGGASVFSPAAVPILSTADPPIAAPRPYARTGMLPNRKALRPGWRLAGDQGSPGVLRRRGDTFLVLGFLAGFIVLTLIKWMTIQHNAQREMIADVTQKTSVLSEAMKPVALPPLTTTPSVPNPSASKTQAQPSIVEPLPVEKIESVIENILDTWSKDSPRPTNASKKPLRAIAVKTPSHRVESALTRDHSTNELARVSTNVNTSPIAKAQQQAPSSSPPTPPQLETKIGQPANLALFPTNDVRPPEPVSKASSVPSANRPATPADITAAVAILADPYPSLRIPNGSSKKQRQGASLQLGRLLSRVEPIYPEDAKQQGIQGTVKLHAIIDRHGSIGNLQSVNGPPVLVAAAMNAVRQWRFTETLLAGRSVETEEDIDIVFRLSNPAAPRK
jgi:TonB family protein